MSLDAIALPIVAKPEKTPLARLAVASMVGTILEWYDFTIYKVFRKVRPPEEESLSTPVR